MAPVGAQRIARASRDGRSRIQRSDSSPRPPEAAQNSSKAEYSKKAAQVRLLSISAVAELLFEHCFAGKCSTSHVLATGCCRRHCGCRAAAPSHSCKATAAITMAAAAGTLFCRALAPGFSRKPRWHPWARKGLPEPARRVGAGFNGQILRRAHRKQPRTRPRQSSVKRVRR